MNNSDFVNILKSQVSPAIGCTEPVSVAIAVSTAYAQVKGETEEIQIETSLNIFKNGMRVGIPGTSEKGIVFAAALAVVCGAPELGLEVFRNVDKACVEKAKSLREKKSINVSATTDNSDFFIRVRVKTDVGLGECVVKNSHTNVVSIKKDEELIYQADKSSNSETDEASASTQFGIKEILGFAESANPSEISFLLEGVKMNREASHTGAKTKYSTGLGKNLFDLMEKGDLSMDSANKVRAVTASACDARMAGLKIPVMSSAGSGNHGITAILPVAVIAEELVKSDEELSRALAISHLVTSCIKRYTGKLSPVCGCAVAAGTGAAAAITWLMGGDIKEIDSVINNMIGCLAGMLCDGAKGGCSFKVATAASEAYYQSIAVLNGSTIEAYDGLIGNSVSESLVNLGRISRDAMLDVDKILVEILSTPQA